MSLLIARVPARGGPDMPDGGPSRAVRDRLAGRP
ncbi:hypothetical protein K373_01402 [Streptomyces sp. DvalAA-21]|nr:hypothetical protein SACTE_0629 [Streptomyces sp. SirexAA-E]PZX42912.1 hypothetical protein K373_01402 [Streptomyces sp. DvalAA-21]RAJ39056.1 hypothetical protein K351_00697 [Streptomyces sp. DpondAA-E10]RAJ53017.1 hypothetical protein K352_00093 [Streptomyces sp. DpondAA-A50]SCD64967.1 hypothetical protein GA0115239_10503 [Streptomyces sp. BpilaLS-43]SCD95767.1 hypothetical protein GA0115235_110167 [Streptomyces sp. DpondAA-F4a]SCM13946.1 hypothetical protein SAMN04883147_1098165 [Strepto